MSLLTVESATKHFAANRSLGELLTGRRRVVKAVDGVTFSLRKGESVGLVGESGCGKTTLGRMLLRLITPTAGSITFDGTDLAALKGEALTDFRRRAQLVFQNPFEALNPRFTIKAAVAEPLKNTRAPAETHEERMARAMERVRLPDMDAYYGQYPHQLSGGQLQRVVLARALVLEPEFIVADEPVSMLDVSVRAGILNVMREIGEEMEIAAIYISHDLALVRYVCARTITMYLGAVVEDGPTEEVVRDPQHPYTRALVQAVPTPHVDQSREALPIEGGIPNPTNPPAGCRFRDRCPHSFARCADEVPMLRKISATRSVACHLHDA